MGASSSPPRARSSSLHLDSLHHCAGGEIAESLGGNRRLPLEPGCQSCGGFHVDSFRNVSGNLMLLVRPFGLGPNLNRSVAAGAPELDHVGPRWALHSKMSAIRVRLDRNRREPFLLLPARVGFGFAVLWERDAQYLSVLGLEPDFVLILGSGNPSKRPACHLVRRAGCCRTS